MTEPRTTHGSADWRATRAGRRSLLIFAAGGLIGLATAGYSLFTARGTVVGGVPPEDVALVNQRPILVSDFNAQIEAELGKPAASASLRERRTVREEMIREELFVQRGLELDMPSSDPATRAALVAAVEQQATADAVSEQPDRAAFRRFYDAHRAAFSTEGTMSLRDYRAADRAAAALGAAALRRGATGELVPAGLADSGRSAEEEFYFAAAIHLGPRRFAAARRLRSGEVSDPVEDKDGWHVLAMHTNVPPVAQPFEAALPAVMTAYRQAAAARSLADELRYLRDTADIRIARRYR